MCCCIIGKQSFFSRKSAVIFGNRRQCSFIFGKCPETFDWSSENVWGVFGNLRLLVDMEFLFPFPTLYLTSRKFEINYIHLRAPIYHPLFMLEHTGKKKKLILALRDCARATFGIVNTSILFIDLLNN